MRTFWTRVGIIGPISMAFGSVLWSAKTEADHTPPYDLKLVQVLFRHGARTPLKSIPDVMEAQWEPKLLEPPAHTHIKYVVTDLNGGPKPPAPVEESYRKMMLTGGSFPGQLTTLGMQQLYDLGKTLRTRYIEEKQFLSPAFNLAEVYVRSTNIVRTIESAKCLVAGLFQQEQRDVVTILTEAAESEVLYPNYHGCKMLKMLCGHRWMESSTLPDVAADLQSIQRALGIATDQRVDFVLIRDDMVARQAHGLPCPPALDTWKDTIEQRAVDMMCHLYKPNLRETLQLSVGPLLHILLSNIEEKVQGTSSEPERKLFLYSAHDTTLMPCLMALGIFDMKWPPYAADLTLELYQHRQTNEAFVKVSYVGQDQLIPGCSGLYCPLEEFRKAVSAYSLSSELHLSLCDNTEGLIEP
ncbi:lysophosphatidic acid phosphatase type 6 [Takifugu flavidus]|uniref:Lysophosphatidic acid phosphatase type 6 n=1 Tax=Takifugu flavidus TaxID=433684 RepID=A0A5C6PPX0_9TELE|nr:lysophosphatidic acid phosphatase type 6 [Takifugu flavidus]XP_056905961.1 lysophosphatidic acid phosphatase type 6 [Takifugu flavidus]XP_056905969.1 lysophosphatidic acid phosphatase type 6 [Takifugu flavidus]TWW80926.1 Lysophosphatidic acid phosphatase type 6 [Takifugu flavidus]